MSEPEKEKCQGIHCDGKGEAQAPHPCPYKSDINDDNETLCNCCEGCAFECAQDI